MIKSRLILIFVAIISVWCSAQAQNSYPSTPKLVMERFMAAVIRADGKEMIKYMDCRKFDEYGRYKIASELDSNLPDSGLKSFKVEYVVIEDDQALALVKIDRVGKRSITDDIELNIVDGKWKVRHPVLRNIKRWLE